MLGKHYLPDYTVPAVKIGGGQIILCGFYGFGHLGHFCVKLCGSSLVKALLYSSMHKAMTIKVWLGWLAWKTFTGLSRSQTSTPLNTIGMNENCEPGSLISISV